MKHLHFFTRILLALALAGTTGLAQQSPHTPALPAATPPPAGSPRPAGATMPPPAGTDELIGPINMPGDSLDAVLALMERWTGKTLLRPQNLPAATITFILKDRVTKAEAIQAIETLLNLNGIAITPLGNRFLKVTSLNTAKSEAPEYIEGSTLGLTPSGRTAQKLFTLQFLRVAEFMPQIAGLLNPAAGSPPVVFDKANAALITDSVSNLQRVETLVARLDQPSLAGLTSRFFPLHAAKASDVANKLHVILSGQLQNQLGSTTTYSPDDRTNQIVLIADSRQFPFFAELIEKLDVKSDTNTRNEVIYLKHATAKDVATILTQLVTGQNNASKATGQENVARGPQSPATATVQQPGQPPTTVSLPAVGAAALGLESGANQFSSILTILPEERTNAIVVSGTVDDIRLINQLVEKIDILLAQVRIEIVVAEVSLSDKATSGIDSLGLQVVNGRLTGISGSGPGASLAGSTASSFATLVNGSLSGIVSISTNPRKGSTTILSVPTITTTHNKEAKIFVGETIPTITGTTSSNAAVGATTPYTTSSINQQEVGITITVKPLIGTDNSVQLDLKQEISDVGAPVTIDGNVQNIILKRTTSSFITAKSGEILVLGGLQKKSNSKSTSRLGPIPILGDIFGTRTRDEERTELVFFLRPTVLTNTPADNVDAFGKVEQLPKKQREEVKSALGVQPGS